MAASPISFGSMSAGDEILRSAEIGVHGALAVRRHHDVAARGRRTVGSGRRIEGDLERADVVAEDRAEIVVAHLADEGRARAEARDAGDGVGGRAAGAFGRRTHGLVDRLRAILVDQRHAALLHVLLDQEIVLGAGNDIDDGIADSENVVAGRGHSLVPLRLERRRTIAMRGTGGKSIACMRGDARSARR